MRIVRWALALRALLVVPALAAIGLGPLDNPTLAGAACLAALLILLCDFRRPNAAAYLITGIACAVATALGSLTLPALVTVALVVVLSATLGVVKGFGGFAGVASVTVVAELLIAVGLRAGGAAPVSVLVGVVVGCTVSVVVAVLLPAPRQTLLVLTADLRQSYARALRGETVPADGSHALVRAYVQATDRPQAPDRASADALHRLSSLARLGDLLQVPFDVDDFTLASSRVLLGGPAPGPEPDTAWQRQVAYAVGVIADPRPAPAGEWLRQLRVRLQPDALLFVQGSVAAALYGSLTAMVLLLTPPHPQWILLGAVTATYPYARRAAIVVRNLLVGTVLAFVGLLLVAPLADAHPVAWWVVFLVAVAVACAVPHSTRGWIAGQVAFTSLSLSLLALAVGRLPAEAIVIRFENVIIGGTAAIVVALVLAPRHMRQRLQRALASLYDVAGEPDLDLRRAQFLRCVDVIDSMRGSGYVGVERLTRWLDAARNVVQVGVIQVLLSVDDGGHARRCAAALRRNQAVPSYAGDQADLDAVFEAAREDLQDLSPLRQRTELM